MRSIGFILILVASICLKSQSQEVDEGLIDLATANNRFAIKLYKNLSTKNDNLFFSPLTLSTAFSMLYAGAREETAAEINKVLEHAAEGLRDNDLHEEFKKFQLYLRSETGYTLDFINTLYIQNNYKILDEFLELLKNYYNSTAQNVDFATNGEKVMQDINKIVAEITHDKITDFLKKPLEPLTRLFLMSVVYFKGTWRTVFNRNRTKPAPFFNEGVTPSMVPMMRMSKGRFPYADVQLPSGGVYALEMPYEGDDATMVILLPEERTGLKQLEEALDLETIGQILNNLKLVLVHVAIPRFHVEGDYDLPKTLYNMGMTKAFSRDEADLSGITGNKDLHVEEVIHKAVIDVNEEGTEAAAATGISTATRSRGPRWASFRADHPFIFFIRDVRTDFILFMGRVNKLP